MENPLSVTKACALCCAVGAGAWLLARKNTPWKSKKFLVVFGAQVDVRGVSPASQEKFGKLQLKDYIARCARWSAKIGTSVEFFPPVAEPTKCNDIEALCDAIRAAPARGCHGILINPGHFTRDAAAAEAIGQALASAGLPSINTHYSSSPIARSCPVIHHTTGVVLGVKEHGMRLGLLALDAMSDEQFTAHDA
eukprot:g4436.t1